MGRLNNGIVIRNKAWCQFWVVIKISQDNIEHALYIVGREKTLCRFWVVLYIVRKTKTLCRFWVVIKMTQGDIEHAVYTVRRGKALCRFWVVMKNIQQWSRVYARFIYDRRFEEKVMCSRFCNSIVKYAD